MNILPIIAKESCYQKRKIRDAPGGPILRSADLYLYGTPSLLIRSLSEIDLQHVLESKLSTISKTGG